MRKDGCHDVACSARGVLPARALRRRAPRRHGVRHVRGRRSLDRARHRGRLSPAHPRRGRHAEPSRGDGTPARRRAAGRLRRRRRQTPDRPRTPGRRARLRPGPAPRHLPGDPPVQARRRDSAAGTTSRRPTASTRPTTARPGSRPSTRSATRATAGSSRSRSTTRTSNRTPRAGSSSPGSPAPARPTASRSPASRCAAASPRSRRTPRTWPRSRTTPPPRTSSRCSPR